MTIALHVSGVTITHFQEHKTTVTTASGNGYTVIDRVKFTDKEYRKTKLKLQLNNVYFAENHSSTIAADNNTGMYIIHYSIELIAFSA